MARNRPDQEGALIVGALVVLFAVLVFVVLESVFGMWMRGGG